MKRTLTFIIILFLASISYADDLTDHGSVLLNDISDVKCQDNYLYCAFYHGVGVINLELDYFKKRLYSSVDIPGIPISVHPFGDILAVETETGEVSIINISDPRDIRYLGSFTPEWEIWDIERIGDFIYVAIEYNGIARYDISDPYNINFDDSNMVGIRVTKLAVEDTLLFALDDYNGILVYSPDEQGFGEIISELLLPEQAISFAIDGDTLYAGLKPNGYSISLIEDIHNLVYLERRESFIRGDNLAVTDKGVILSNNTVGFELIYDNNGNPIDQIFALNEILGFGNVFNFDNHNFIVYPHDIHGFGAYVIDDPITINIAYPNLIYASPGPITKIKFINSRLHSMGPNNRYEIFSLENPDQPFRDGVLMNPPYNPLGAFTIGDTVFVADLQTHTIFPAVDIGYGNPRIIQPFYSFGNSFGSPEIIQDYFGEDDLIYFINNQTVRGARRTNEGLDINYFNWVFPANLLGVLLDDTITYVSGEGGGIQVYSIDDEFGADMLVNYPLDGVYNDFAKVGNILYAGGDNLQMIDVSMPVFPSYGYVSTQPGTVYDLLVYGNNLYCAAENGIFIYDISGGKLDLLFSGGKKATFLDINDKYIAASDGKSVKIYSSPIVTATDPIPDLFELETAGIEGYPNPFNPNIQLSLSGFKTYEDIMIDIYDILGRKIRSINIKGGPAENIQTSWDGRGEDGQPAASGVYFFKAFNATQNAVLKAVLLK